jgi:hypothetical protein
MTTLKNTNINDTGYLQLARGTTSQRPSNPSIGTYRYNTDLKNIEYFNGTRWILTTSLNEIVFDKSTDILSLDPTASTGWYWIRVNGVPRRYWVDNKYDGGGWVLVASHPINVALPALTYAQSAESYDGYSSSTYGSGNPLTYSVWVGLVGWNLIARANNAGRNVVYFTSASQCSLGDVSLHSRRSRWKWDGWNVLFSWNNANTLVNELGGVTPGLWAYHIVGAYNFTSFDRDQDTLAGNCSVQFNNSPWWYGNCWDGSIWGANGGATYQNAAYWTGSSTDYYNYGAIYIK